RLARRRRRGLRAAARVALRQARPFDRVRFCPAVLAAGALLLAGCGSSTPKAPPAFVFVSTRDGDYAIFGADANGGHQHRLSKEKGDPSTPQGLFFETDPAWSPDGKRLAFASRRNGTDRIFTMNLDGSGVRQLTSSAQDDSHP